LVWKIDKEQYGAFTAAYLNIGTTENGMDEIVYRKRLIKSLYIEKMVFMLFSNQNKNEDEDGKKL